MKISRRVVSNDGSARKEEKVLTIRCDRQITHFPPCSVDFNFKTGKKSFALPALLLSQQKMMQAKLGLHCKGHENVLSPTLATIYPTTHVCEADQIPLTVD